MSFANTLLASGSSLLPLSSGRKKFELENTVLITFYEHTVELIATNGNVLGVAEIKNICDVKSGTFKFTKSDESAAKMFAGASDISLHANQNGLVIDSGQATFLLEKAERPRGLDLGSIFRGNTDGKSATTATFNRKLLEKAVKVVSKLSDDDDITIQCFSGCGVVSSTKNNSISFKVMFTSSGING